MKLSAMHITQGCICRAELRLTEGWVGVSDATGVKPVETHPRPGRSEHCRIAACDARNSSKPDLLPGVCIISEHLLQVTIARGRDAADSALGCSTGYSMLTF